MSLYYYAVSEPEVACFEKNLNASRPSSGGIGLFKEKSDHT